MFEVVGFLDMRFISGTVNFRFTIPGKMHLQNG